MGVQICYLCNVSTRVLSRKASVSLGHRREATLSSHQTEVMIIGNGDNGRGDTEKKGLSSSPLNNHIYDVVVVGSSRPGILNLQTRERKP